jgi:hypothetical protein
MKFSWSLWVFQHTGAESHTAASEAIEVYHQRRDRRRHQRDPQQAPLPQEHLRLQPEALPQVRLLLQQSLELMAQQALPLHRTPVQP